MISTGPGVRLAVVTAPRLKHLRDPWLRKVSVVGMTFPLAGQPGPLPGPNGDNAGS